MQHYIRMDSPVGLLTVVAENEALVGVFIECQKNPLSPGAYLAPADPVLTQAESWLRSYFAGENPDPLSLPLAPAGTVFQKTVWNLLLQIPYGMTVTYGELAKKLPNPRTSAQAVGQAVGHNPIGIIIPCHRVIGAGDRLTGYNGGIQNKIILLNIEGIDTSRMKLPKEKQHG